MDNQRDLFSGEAFDLRAFWPAPGTLSLKDAAPSGKSCECEVFLWKSGRRTTPKFKCNSKRAFWYQVNHLVLALCRFHAAQLARRRGVVVSPYQAAVDAMMGH